MAVVEDASMLTSSEMQMIAPPFNLSETGFVLPSAHAARIWIFTATDEMPFAGHPTLGSAHLVHDVLCAGERFALEIEAGISPGHRQTGAGISRQVFRVAGRLRLDLIKG